MQKRWDITANETTNGRGREGDITANETTNGEAKGGGYHDEGINTWGYAHVDGDINPVWALP